VANVINVTDAAMKSDIGSAKNTANTLSAKKFGRIYINGINKMIFLNNAKNMDTLACPRATNVCWHEFCAAMTNAVAK